VIRGLLSLLSLLSRGLALNLMPPAFARRRLEKSSIYLSCKWVSAVSAARTGPTDNSDNSDNRSFVRGLGPAFTLAAVTALVMIAEIRWDG